MRYAILSDIHGNLEALESVLKACRQEGARSIFCSGDIVGYGANPSECVELIRQHKIISVAGNHDWAAIGKFSTKDFNIQAKMAIEWTENKLSQEDKCFLNDLPTIFKNTDFVMVHGTLYKPENFIYLTDILQAQDTFYLMDRNICFVGHSHVPQIYIHTQEKIIFSKTLTEYIDKKYKYIVNAGSVGQPRDNQPTASFCIFDPDLERVEIKRVMYDVKKAQQKILEAQLPEFLAYRLTIGQ